MAKKRKKQRQPLFWKYERRLYIGMVLFTITVTVMFNLQAFLGYAALQRGDLVSVKSRCISVGTCYGDTDRGSNLLYSFKLENGVNCAANSTPTEKALSVHRPNELQWIVGKELTYTYKTKAYFMFENHLLVSISDGGTPLLPIEAVYNDYKRRFKRLFYLNIFFACLPIVSLMIKIPYRCIKKQKAKTQKQIQKQWKEERHRRFQQKALGTKREEQK